MVAGGVALGATLAGLGIANAQTDGSTTTTAPAGSVPEKGEEEGRRVKPFRHHDKLDRFGAGPGIHGEFTTRGRDGGFQTIATQRGEVTEVSASSLTVKSEDGFTRTYAVDDNTLVAAGDDGIADVKVGDKVAVTAVVVDGKASAVDVRDATQVRALRDRWAPGRR